MENRGFNGVGDHCTLCSYSDLSSPPSTRPPTTSLPPTTTSPSTLLEWGRKRLKGRGGVGKRAEESAQRVLCSHTSVLLLSLSFSARPPPPTPHRRPPYIRSPGRESETETKSRHDPKECQLERPRVRDSMENPGVSGGPRPVLVVVPQTRLFS